MAKLVRMSDYVRPAQAWPGETGQAADDDRSCGAPLAGSLPGSSLRLRMDDILGRDYRQPEHVIHGILRIRDILDRHLGAEPAWQGLLLDLLREACPARRAGRPKPGGPCSAQRLQACIEDRIESRNALELGSAVVILKLMEHSPTARKLLRDIPHADPLASG